MYKKILMKFIVFKFFFLIFINSSYLIAKDFPTIPGDIDIVNKTYCANKGEKFGHVVILLDTTSKLEKSQINFIRDQVFSSEFYLSREPFTKFSYMLINDKATQEQEYIFSKCRPKSGAGPSKLDLPSFKENKKILMKFFDDFNKDALKTQEQVFKSKTISNSSLIFETIFYLFQNPKRDFSEIVGKRELIIVSDMMQHSDRISFYKVCNAVSNLAKCPSFQTFMQNLSIGDKNYLATIADKGKGINVKLIYLNNVYEKNKEIDTSLISLWENYFNDRGFGKIEIIRQLDIR